jgi:hypothetical protein
LKYGDVRAKSLMLRLIVGSDWIACEPTFDAVPARWVSITCASATTFTVSVTVARPSVN